MAHESMRLWFLLWPTNVVREHINTEGDNKLQIFVCFLSVVGVVSTCVKRGAENTKS